MPRQWFDHIIMSMTLFHRDQQRHPTLLLNLGTINGNTLQIWDNHEVDTPQSHLAAKNYHWWLVWLFLQCWWRRHINRSLGLWIRNKPNNGTVVSNLIECKSPRISRQSLSNPPSYVKNRVLSLKHFWNYFLMTSFPVRMTLQKSDLEWKPRSWIYLSVKKIDRIWPTSCLLNFWMVTFFSDFNLWKTPNLKRNPLTKTRFPLSRQRWIRWLSQIWWLHGV